VVAPDVPCEGELRGSTQSMQPLCNKIPEDKDPEGINDVSLKRKRADESEREDLDEPHKTRGRRPNYCYLNDPFPDEEEVGMGTESEELSLVANITVQSEGDEPKSLSEAKRSLEWPEWEFVINEELAQLLKKGTWRLVNKPMNAIPIMNQWVFMRKYNKNSDLLKYKGRLVAKGCSQRPGQDYDETFTPIVRLETMRAILAMAVTSVAAASSWCFLPF
jgi:hypothetical protein